MLAAFQDGWALDWLKQAFTPGVALAFVAISIATWRATTDYGRLKHLEAAVAGIRADMVCKGDFEHTIQEMEVRLERLADSRFLGAKDLALINSVSHHQQAEIDELRHHVLEILGKWSPPNSKGA